MLKKRYLISLVAFVLLFMMACSTSQTTFNNDSNEMDNEYRIGKSDVLEVSVWKEDDLTRTVKVRQDGMISLPLIDDVRAAGKTTAELKNVIQNRLKKYIEHPTVSVIVEDQNSKKYYVVGEVEDPGEYNLNKDITVLQAISNAGGFTEWADKENIILIRKIDGEDKRMAVNYYNLVSGKNSERNAVLRANDTVVVQ